ncbi:MAG: hypothetical protein IKU45_00115 [Clostridia bacterium]|nr:hypothetical protein [Clostridia bacterium]
MILTRLKPPKLSENTISAFGGINKTPKADENCFFDTQNVSSSFSPLLSTREKRLTLCLFDSLPSALHTVNGITYTVDNKLYHNGVLQFDGLTNTEKKQIVSMGANVIIFPDGYYINTLTKDDEGVCSEKGYLSQKFVANINPVVFVPCVFDTVPDISPTRPTSAYDMMLWLDRSTVPNRILQFSAIDRSWNPIESTHLAIIADGIEEGFSENDTIEATGIDEVFSGQNTIVNKGENYLIVHGLINNFYSVIPTVDHPIIIERSVPLMDFVCEHQNRLFGCRYGKNKNGEFVNEIYASKLGDPKSWNTFEGLSTDSYAASCGSEGEWTGIASHMGYVVFFKERRIHRLYGTKPSNFTLYQDEYPGVKKGSENSLCLTNGTLFYHSENGIYAYSGSSPVCLSDALGNEKYSNASAAFYKNVYYICMEDSKSQKHLFTYDLTKGIWLREDDSNYTNLSCFESNILGIKKTEKGNSLELLHGSSLPSLCKQIYGNSAKLEEDFEWFAESGKLGLKNDVRKFVNKLKIRLEATANSVVSVYIQLDSSGVWECCGSFSSTKLTPFNFDIIPPRCDHFSLKICGKGSCKIYSLSKVIETASEVF